MRGWKLLPEWLLALQGIEGFDEPDDDDDDDDEVPDPDDTGNNDEDDDDDDDDGDDPKAALKATRDALKKERLLRRTREKELRKLKKVNPAPKKDEPKPKPKPVQKEGEEDNGELSAAQQAAKDAEDRASDAEGKNAALAKKLSDDRVDNLIRKHAAALGFIDPEDAVLGVDRSDIDVDQDEDDPTDIDIDETSVKDAVKALKKAKKHLVKTREQREASGDVVTSKFGGGRQKGGKDVDDEELFKLYPKLRR